MQYTISRFVNGICLNEKEFVLDDNDEVKLFSKTEALSFMDYETIEDAEEDWIFIEPCKIPNETLDKFIDLASSLSPENLHCDGEISQTEAMRKFRRLTRDWKILEKQVGFEITESEIWDMECDRQEERV